MLYDNRYEHIKDLGQGGFGRVFLAKEVISNRLVAIKQLININKDKQEDMIHEIEIVSKFQNPNIVAYHHNFWQDRQLFLVMEYCPGGNLREKIKAKDYSKSDVFHWMISITECLKQVHEKDIIHHDIKPDNILFSDNGVIKISDFGIANTGGGTRSYMSPEALNWDSCTTNDVRVDVYALGVTLMELLIGKNPFFFQSREQILELHEKAEFGIENLPSWQQEIILKAINKVPELRFQYMGDFKEAIKGRAVPVIFERENLRAAQLAEYAEKALKTKKWRSAARYLELAESKYPNNVSVLQIIGKYYLRMQKIQKAKEYFERALRLNPHLDLQKDLGWIHVENKNYPLAISLLSDHLHRHPSDYEAYNLLLRCYYETGRYEPAMELAKMLMESNEKLLCFANNYYISNIMHNIGTVVFPDTILKAPDNPFVDYNQSVVLEGQESHAYEKKPTLKSKLLFMDYHFNNISQNKLSILDENKSSDWKSFKKCIIKIGREGYDANDIKVAGGTSISRRHCLIINSKDDVWIYDLNSTGTYLNDERINHKAPLIGLNKLRINNVGYIVTTDESKLL